MESQIEQNKATVRAFFEIFNSKSIGAALATLDDDATIWSASGTRTKSEMLGIVEAIEGMFEIPLTITPGVMTAEDDRVAMEATSYGKLKNGKVYANTYHFLFVLRDGKIIDYREHNDSKHSAEVFQST